MKFQIAITKIQKDDKYKTCCKYKRVNDNYLRTNSTKVVDMVKYNCWQTSLARFTVSWLFIIYCQNDKREQRACKLELEFFPATRKCIDGESN